MAELMDSILVELQCPACQSYMHPPIRQCQLGHSICTECFLKVKFCPYCRGPKDTVSRNFVLEAIHDKLSIPCKNFDLGCQFMSLGKEIVRHESFCEHSSRPCPFIGCHWSGIRGRLKEHLLRSHSQSFYIQAEQRFTVENFKKNRHNRYSCNSIVFAFREFFLLIWDLDALTGKISQFLH